mmetsp:Transcript_21130/g.18739  ORF Transcript_21130/g.18739 Transcript_21130/m.18739 type:complete len:303 (+) Transcript_21130:6-914(+)
MLGRVSGYSGFDSYNVTGVCTAKPGQTSITRDYYKDANTVTASGKTYLASYSRFGSNHQQTFDKAVKPADYKRASRGGKQNLKYEFLHNPELFEHTKEGTLQRQSESASTKPRLSNELSRAGNAASTSQPMLSGTKPKMYKTTSHWQTSYQVENNKTQQRPSSKAERPFWSYPKRNHVARRTFFKTEYENKMGNYGHNPRNVLNHKSTKLEPEISDLTMGTTKVTSHIPGYGGFLVRTDLNEKALGQTKNNITKNLMKNKTNMNENFNVKLPGYSGHKPLSFANEKGNPRPNLFSTHGEKFF